MAKYTGKERRVEPDRDIKPGGKYHGIVGQDFHSPYSNDTAERCVPEDIRRIVSNSEGRLELKIRSRDDDDDCYTEFRVKAVERRENK
jgi:hypothetical protein